MVLPLCGIMVMSAVSCSRRKLGRPERTRGPVMIPQRTLSCIPALLAALLAVGCSSRNFIVYKDRDAFYLTSDCARQKQVLCQSGDAGRVVDDSGLPESMRFGLKDRMCGPGRDRKALLAILEGMTDAQHAALQDAFRRHGYEINKVADS